MIIKHHPTALLINSEIDLKSGVTGHYVNHDDPTTWKYYLNLAGEYHVLDQPMTIVSLDTTQPIQFNRANILLHRSTNKEYVIGSQYYTELVKRYPLQEDLIKGILNPIDINVAIEAPDYTILHWDKMLIEPNETNLLDRLQEYIDLAVDRWFIKDYTLTDPLYPLALLMLIYSFIPAWINEIRLQNVKSYKAHSFHIWNYLDSFGNLSQYRDFLTRSQVLWLYRNIEWVMNNAGKEHTFQELLHNICSVRGIPLGAYSVRHNTKLMPGELVPTVDAVRYPLNLLDRINPDPEINSLRFLMEKSLSKAKFNPDFLAQDLARAEREIPRALMSEVPIKVYESEMLDTTDSQSFKLGDVLVMQWAYWSHLKRYNSVITIQNPYTTDIMTMSVKDAFITWLYAMNKFNGVELEIIPDMVATNVLRVPPPTFAELRAMSQSKYISDKLIQDKIDLQPAVGTIISTDVFNEACHEIHAVMLELEYQWETRETALTRANHELVARAFYADVGFKLVPTQTTYLEYFAMHGWDVATLGRSDLDLLVKSIYDTALGIDVTNVKTIGEIQEAMLKLMSQLGTYDVQYIQSINTSAAIPLDPYPVLLDDFPQDGTQIITPDEFCIPVLEFPVQGNIGVDMTTPVIEVEHITDKDVVLNIDVTLDMNMSVTRNKTYDLSLADLEFDFPDIGNIEDLIISGTVLDPIIDRNQLKNLKEEILDSDLDGLEYPKG